jgi:hypothetical protein
LVQPRNRRDVAFGSTCEILTASRCFPLCSQQRSFRQRSSWATSITARVVGHPAEGKKASQPQHSPRSPQFPDSPAGSVDSAKGGPKLRRLYLLWRSSSFAKSDIKSASACVGQESVSDHLNAQRFPLAAYLPAPAIRVLTASRSNDVIIVHGVIGHRAH